MNMFGKQKINEDTDKKKEKLLRKVSGKDTSRKIHGFQCSPKIWAFMRELATKLHVPLFALLEHALQLGAMQITDAIQETEEREILRDHVLDVHAGQRLVEKIARYDEDAADWLDENRRRQFELDSIFRKLVVKYGRHVASRDIDGLIEDGMRYRIARANGQFGPNGFSKNDRSNQSQGSSENQAPNNRDSDGNNENQEQPD